MRGTPVGRPARFIRLPYYRLVMSAASVVSLVLELVTWITLVPGVALLIVGYVRRALASRYEQTWGVVVPSPAGTAHPWFRWMDASRELKTAPLPIDGDESLQPGDEITVYIDRRNPDRGRLDDPATDGRPQRIIGWVLVSIGIASAVVQLIALLVE